jgi:hypothetical protein
MDSERYEGACWTEATSRSFDRAIMEGCYCYIAAWLAGESASAPGLAVSGGGWRWVEVFRLDERRLKEGLWSARNCTSTILTEEGTNSIGGGKERMWTGKT